MSKKRKDVEAGPWEVAMARAKIDIRRRYSAMYGSDNLTYVKTKLGTRRLSLERQSESGK